MIVDTSYPVDEAPGFLLLRVIKYLLRRSFFINNPLIHIQNTIGEVSGKIHFMGNNNHGHAIFGETAVRRKMRLKLIVHLVRKETMEREFERLPYEPLFEDILDVPVQKVVIAVDAGRNLAVLVEAAVRNTILQLRGIDTYRDFIERHQRVMGRPQE